MGCDIHIITEVRAKGVWDYVPDIPDSLNVRDYNAFTILADVRNDDCSPHLEAKGLPDDLSTRHAGFISYMPYVKEHYENGTVEMIRLPKGCQIMPDGGLVKYDDERFKTSISMNEYLEQDKRFFYQGTYTDSGIKCYKYDYTPFGGVCEYWPIKNFYSTLQQYLEQSDEWNADWDENAQDYGCWNVDFDSADYHSHSHLTLGELVAFAAGRDEDLDCDAIKRGIRELESIAYNHGVNPYTHPNDIRIVFAFDN